MKKEIAIEILKEEINRYDYNLNRSESSEYLGQADKEFFTSRINALELAVKELEKEVEVENCENCKYKANEDFETPYSICDDYNLWTSDK